VSTSFTAAAAFLHQSRPSGKREFITGDYTPARKDLAGTFGGPIIKNKTFFFADVKTLVNGSRAVQGNQSWEAPEFVAWAQQNFPTTVGTQGSWLFPASFLRPNGTTTKAPATICWVSGLCLRSNHDTAERSVTTLAISCARLRKLCGQSFTMRPI
jgi:hypothetical protein